MLNVNSHPLICSKCDYNYLETLIICNLLPHVLQSVLGTRKGTLIYSFCAMEMVTINNNS